MIEKERLLNLYLIEKRSSFEISKILNCSEHKVNYWIDKYGIKKRSMSEAMYIKRNPNGDPFKVIQPQNIEEAMLFGLGLGLYWGEGNKKNKDSIRLGNTDPKLIKKFLEFLIKFLGIEKNKIKFGLQIFSDMPPQKVFKFWLDNLRELGFNKGNFYKITVTPARSIGTYREKSKYGVLTVCYGNVKLKKILDGMLPE